MAIITSSSILGVILAGGQGRRMGGTEKSLIKLGGRPLLGRVIDRLRPQVGALVLSANGDPERFASFGLAVVEDATEGFAGPLAGILAAMVWARENAPQTDFIATTAVDTPFFPTDLVSRLAAMLDDGHDLAVAESNGRVHPVFGLFRVSLAGDLAGFLSDPDNRAAIAWIESRRGRVVPFNAPDDAGVDPFFNINTPADLAAAERMA
jgi:molybdenum cofactor guanylyltransferase